MKKIGKLFLAVFIGLFSSALVVNAASNCDYNEQVELNNTVANIKVSFEEAEGQVDPSLLLGGAGVPEDAIYYYFKVQFYNVSEDVYLKITNDINNDVKYLYYKDSESGVLEFDWYDLENVVNFNIEVYASNKTNCVNELYRIMYLTLPRYNKYSSRAKCTGNESFYLCQKYITETEEIDESRFENEFLSFSNKKIEEEKRIEEANKSWLNKVGDFISENKITIIVISTIIVVSGVVTTVIVIKKRRSRLI